MALPERSNSVNLEHVEEGLNKHSHLLLKPSHLSRWAHRAALLLHAYKAKRSHLDVEGGVLQLCFHLVVLLLM